MNQYWSSMLYESDSFLTGNKKQCGTIMNALNLLKENLKQKTLPLVETRDVFVIRGNTVHDVLKILKFALEQLNNGKFFGDIEDVDKFRALMNKALEDAEEIRAGIKPLQANMLEISVDNFSHELNDIAEDLKKELERSPSPIPITPFKTRDVLSGLTELRSNLWDLVWRENPTTSTKPTEPTVPSSLNDLGSERVYIHSIFAAQLEPLLKEYFRITKNQAVRPLFKEIENIPGLVLKRSMSRKVAAADVELETRALLEDLIKLNTPILISGTQFKALLRALQKALVYEDEEVPPISGVLDEGSVEIRWSDLTAIHEIIQKAPQSGIEEYEKRCLAEAMQVFKSIGLKNEVAVEENEELYETANEFYKALNRDAIELLESLKKYHEKQVHSSSHIEIRAHVYDFAMKELESALKLLKPEKVFSYSSLKAGTLISVTASDIFDLVNALRHAMKIANESSKAIAHHLGRALQELESNGLLEDLPKYTHLGKSYDTHHECFVALEAVYERFMARKSHGTTHEKDPSEIQILSHEIRSLLHKLHHALIILAKEEELDAEIKEIPIVKNSLKVSLSDWKDLNHKFARALVTPEMKETMNDLKEVQKLLETIEPKVEHAETERAGQFESRRACATSLLHQYTLLVKLASGEA